ncbi:hypothetical protein J0H58_11555 [bacterium]|nr:hypothetical protein [bacterium]
MDATGKWAKRGVWLTLAAVLTIGCNPITLTSVLLRSETKTPAQFPLRPKEGPKKDKDEEIKVLVLASLAPGAMTSEFAGADREVSAAIAKLLPEVGKANKETFTVISGRQLDTFKTQNPSWRSMHAATIGKRLGADYVVELSMSGLQMYQPGALNNIYEGKAVVSVDVTATADASAPPQHYVHSFNYPGFPRSADSIPPAQFRIEFVNKLAQEIVFYHVDHKAAEGIAAR